jgi:hypothetical protein
MAEKNPEQQLTLELQDVAEGRKPRSESYLDYAPLLVGSLGGQGSQNWPVMAAAVSYCLDSPGFREKWVEFFAKSQGGLFMGSECWSTTYGLWGHALGVAAVHTHAVVKGHADVADGALTWLRIFWGVYRECTAPDGTILTVGMRSSPWHNPAQCSTWLAWVRAMALGEDQSRWQEEGHRLGLGMGQSFIPPLASAVKASLAAAMSSGSTPGPIPAFTCRTPVHVLRGDGFLAVWVDDNVNGNTPPLAATAWVNGTVTYLPGPFSQVAKIRQQLDDISVTRSAAGLDYTSSLYPPGRIPLPAGGVETVYGDGGASTGGVTPLPEPIASGPVAPEPVAPEPVSPVIPEAVDLGRIADLVASLQVPNREAGDQQRLVAELRAGTSRPLNEIADEVAALGIGPGQPQAVPWQAAIRMLRGESA